MILLVHNTMPVRTKTVVKKSEATAVAAAEVAAKEVAPKKEVSEEEKKARLERRAAHRKQPFEEVYKELDEELKRSYLALQRVSRGFSRLRTAHSREATTKTKREVKSRTPSALFDQTLLDWLHARLDDSEFVIQRTEANQKVEVDLSKIDTNTPVYRTDLVKLYTKIFSKHKLNPVIVSEDGKTSKVDRRFIDYTKDKELTKLLTEGLPAKYASESAEMKAGTFKLDIFNIQKFLTHHITKVKKADA